MSLTPIPVWMKQEVLARDGWECLSCGVTTRIYPGGVQKDDSLHFDHIVPECKRGMTMTENLQVLCRRCNLLKGTRTIDFRPRPVAEEQELDQYRDDLREWSDTFNAWADRNGLSLAERQRFVEKFHPKEKEFLFGNNSTVNASVTAGVVIGLIVFVSVMGDLLISQFGGG